MQISFAALSCSNLGAHSCSNLAALSCSNLAAHCLLQPCGLCVFHMQIRFLALCCSLFAANSCSLFAANSCGLFAANSCGLFAANSCSQLIFVSLYYKEWVLAVFLLVTAASCNWLRVVALWAWGTDKTPLGQNPTRTKPHWTKPHCYFWQGGQNPTPTQKRLKNQIWTFFFLSNHLEFKSDQYLTICTFEVTFSTCH